MNMTQAAPDPVALHQLVDELAYKPRWTFRLEDLDRGQGSQGLTLIIHIAEPDAYHTDLLRGVLHYMPVPPAAFNRQSWRRWLLDQILLVEQHEACEYFTIGGKHVYAPHHGPGNDPYTIFELGTAEEAATPFTG